MCKRSARPIIEVYEESICDRCMSLLMNGVRVVIPAHICLGSFSLDNIQALP